MNIQEIDKWLNNEYGMSYTKLEKLHDWLCDRLIIKDEEIEKLHSIIEEAREYIEKRKEDNKSCSVCSVITDDILEILDKVGEE